jgi:hypothetical protein
MGASPVLYHPLAASHFSKLRASCNECAHEEGLRGSRNRLLAYLYYVMRVKSCVMQHVKQC